MPRIDPLPRDHLAEYEDRLAFVERGMGFVPNSMFTMARVPGLLEGFQELAKAVLWNDVIPADLKQMVGLMASAGGGCRYCQAHTGHTAERLGVPLDKLQEIWSFETSEHFSDAERVALQLAFGAGQVPNAVTDEDFAAAREHWSEEQVTAIVAVISLFGYLNRWNDTMATTLEEQPNHFGEAALRSQGWDRGKHT
ncbi:MAG: carboxymuconolactone decarboxylase family protein [Actinomycetota bacterium]